MPVGSWHSLTWSTNCPGHNDLAWPVHTDSGSYYYQPQSSPAWCIPDSAFAGGCYNLILPILPSFLAFMQTSSCDSLPLITLQDLHPTVSRAYQCATVVPGPFQTAGSQPPPLSQPIHLLTSEAALLDITNSQPWLICSLMRAMTTRGVP